jgi:predicted MFS family arabinose efflux permease
VTNAEIEAVGTRLSARRQLRMMTLYVIILIDSMSIAVLIPVLEPLLLDDKSHIYLIGNSHATRSFGYGALMSIASLIVLYVAPVLATVSDRIGRKNVLVVTTAGLMAANALTSLSIMVESFALLVAARVIAGFTAANQPVSQAALVDMVSEEHRAFHVTMSLLSISLGFVLGPLLAAAFLDLGSHAKLEEEMPFLVLSAAALASMLMLRHCFDDDRELKGRLRIRSLRLNEGITCFRQAVGAPKVRGILLVFLAMQICWATYFLFIDDLLTERFSFDRRSVTIFVASLGLGFCIANGLVQPVLIKLFQFKILAVVGLAATVVIMCMTLYFGQPIEQYGLAVIVGTVSSIAYASIVTMLSKTVSNAEQGWMFGMLGATVALSWACGSFLAGILEYVDPVAPIAMAIAFVAVAAVGMMSRPDPVNYKSSSGTNISP